MDDITKELVEYIEKMGGTVTVNTNPSPEKIKQIEASIKRREDLEVKVRKEYLER